MWIRNSGRYRYLFNALEVQQSQPFQLLVMSGQPRSEAVGLGHVRPGGVWRGPEMSVDVIIRYLN